MEAEFQAEKVENVFHGASPSELELTVRVEGLIC